MNGTRRVRPSSVTETVTPSACVCSCAISRATASGGRSAVKRSIWMRSFGDVAVEQRAFRSVHHWTGAADEPAIDVARIRHQMGDRFLQPPAIEHAVEQFDVLLFLVEEMVDFEPTEVLVLQRGKSFEKNHRLAVAIAIEQGEAALRLLAQEGLDQRHDWRDSRAAGDADQVARSRPRTPS